MKGRRRGGGGRDEVGTSGKWGVLGHFCQDVNEVVQPREVAILPVPFLPGDVMLQGLALRQGRGFPKVNHPHLGLFFLVVDEEERAANDLMALEEGRNFKGGSNGLQPVPVGDLGTERRPEFYTLKARGWVFGPL